MSPSKSVLENLLLNIKANLEAMIDSEDLDAESLDELQDVLSEIDETLGFDMEAEEALIDNDPEPDDD